MSTRRQSTSSSNGRLRSNGMNSSLRRSCGAKNCTTLNRATNAPAAPTTRGARGECKISVAPHVIDHCHPAAASIQPIQRAAYARNETPHDRKPAIMNRPGYCVHFDKLIQEAGPSAKGSPEQRTCARHRIDVIRILPSSHVARIARQRRRCESRGSPTHNSSSDSCSERASRSAADENRCAGPSEHTYETGRCTDCGTFDTSKHRADCRANCHRYQNSRVAERAHGVDERYRIA